LTQRNAQLGIARESAQQIRAGPGPETARVQRRGVRVRDAAVERSAWIALAHTVLRGHSVDVLRVRHLLHPECVPGIPLQRLTAEWTPGRIALSYFVAVVLILAGICLLTNKHTRMAATSLGLTILLAVFWIYLPMLLAAPRDLVALNFFFDTLMFCGAVLLLADAMPTNAVVTAVVG
jgi:uncharacterized membrane protein YphA (DoxX/SURF4 family)